MDPFRSSPNEKAPNLCQPCTRAFAGNAPKLEEKVRYDDMYYIHRDYRSFEGSWKYDKCRLCSDLWHSLGSGIAHPVEQLWSTGLIVAFKVTYFLGSDMKPNWIFWMISFYVREVNTSPTVLKNKYVQRLTQEPERILLAGRWYQRIYDRIYVLSKSVAGQDTRSLDGIGKASSSQPSRELVNSWVRSCVENHRECKPWRNINLDVACPARILDVGEQKTPKIYLRNLDQDTFDEDYITLSYCKGKSKPLQLDKSTKEQLQAGIDPKTLPKTFRNAVAVTRQLGARYLWISSLCIFQDDEIDRRLEGMKTGDINGNSLLNIVASGAEDCDGGLFFERDPSLVKPLQVNMTWPVYQQHAVPVPRTLYDCGVMGEWKEVVDSSEIQNRTWPLQEQFSSRRQIYCCKEQLFWECRRGRGNESYPNSLATAPEAGPIKAAREAVDRLAEEGSWTMMNVGKMEFQPPPDEKRIAEAYSQWTKLIEKITACEVTLQDFLTHAHDPITRDEDILLSFSGIAKRFEILLGDRYSAGLLVGKDFHNNILWFTKQLWPWTITQPSKKLDTLWKAPSWSWASVLGKIEWERPSLQSDVLKSTFMEFVDVIANLPASRKEKGIPGKPGKPGLHVKARKIPLGIDRHRPLGSNLVDPGGMKAPLVWAGGDGCVVFGYGQLDDASHLPQPTTTAVDGVQDAYVGFPVQYRLEKIAQDPYGQEKELKVMGLLVKSDTNSNDVSEGGFVRRIGRFTLEIPILKSQNMVLQYLSEFNNYQKGKQYILI